ncbi:MAG: PAS-domain containing protein, partial [Acidobacteria bacterium]|nr:PAS-domain containing protein [Acidobacteriota bacterium]
MRFWKKKSVPEARRGLRQSAFRGVPHEELLQEALTELVSRSEADRIGVWLEATSAEAVAREGTFHGVVWDREAEITPREWQTLAPQTVLASTLLLSGNAIEMNLNDRTTQPIVGPLTGLSTALWVPVQHEGKLRGILLAGAGKHHRELPKQVFLEVAAALALALAFEAERRISSERHADLAFLGRALSNLSKTSEPETMLQEIVDSCVPRRGQSQNLMALGAAILQIRSGDPKAEKGKSGIGSRCHAGAANLRQLLEMETVKALVCRASEGGRTVGCEVHLPTGEGGLRLVALPLGFPQPAEHVLLAVFQPAQASLAELERLEMRGRFAVTVLRTIEGRDARANESLQKNAILEASLNPIVMLGPGGTIAESNQAARALLPELATAADDEASATKTGPASEKSLYEFFRMRDREKVASWQKKQGVADGCGTHESPEFELDSGARVRLQSRAAGGSHRAITILPCDSKQSAHEKRAEAELLSLAEWLDQGVILYDAQGNLRLLNLRFAQLAGLAPEEIERYKTLEELIVRLQGQSASPENFARHWRELAKRTEGGEREEVHFLRPAARVLERASRPMFDAGGKLLGRIELYKDLTAQRVFQAKLLQTERLAALGQMVSGVAHELSNPLTSILGYAQRLLLRGDSDGNFEEVKKIFGEAERAGAILRRMLLAARETAPDRRVASLNQIVQRTIELQRFSLAAERIRVDVSLDAGLPNIFADAGQMQQVLINLMGNARQAIESQGHGGTIRVRTWRTEDHRVRMEVSDSGPGIPEGIMARIFDPFFTTKAAGVGTGLGLSIVLSLVREHGGQVNVTSPRGNG